MLRPSDIDHKTFLSQGLSDPLPRMRSGSPYVVWGGYIVDFASVVSICRRACNTAEAGEEPFRKRVERVRGYFLLDLALTRGCVLHGGKVGGPHVLSKNQLPHSGFVSDVKSFL
jgi:hypothetical protein